MIKSGELSTLKKIAASYIYKGRDALIKLENIGLQMIPFNYYSPIPSVADMEKGWETRSDHPFFEPEIYDNDAMRSFLESELMPYAKEFDPDNDGDENNTGRYFWNNSQFSYSDALSLYCFVRHVKPKRILEIGGGFSTLIIHEAIKKNSWGEIWEVEPYPRPFLEKIDTITRFFRKQVQELSLELFDELNPGDMLFIDSTHTVKASSDCTFLYLKILNRLQPDIYIHSHDIFLPDSIPIDWHINHQIYWNEHYLLQALLLDTKKFQVLYGSHYHQIFNKELLERFMQNKFPSGGGSFWYKC